MIWETGVIKAFFFVGHVCDLTISILLTLGVGIHLSQCKISDIFPDVIKVIRELTKLSELLTVRDGRLFPHTQYKGVGKGDRIGGAVTF